VSVLADVPYVDRAICISSRELKLVQRVARYMLNFLFFSIKSQNSGIVADFDIPHQDLGVHGTRQKIIGLKV
jgi:hypothetical protein